MPWAKGQSGNPKGHSRRGAQLARLARSKTQDGLELVEFALAVLRGEVCEPPGEDEKPERPSIRDRLDAMKWLADRGWGKTPDQAQGDDGEPKVPASLAEEELEDGLGPEGTVQ